MSAALPSLYGITGHPLGHSLSPALHNGIFQTMGHAGVFLPWAITPKNLPSFVQSVRLLGIRGVAVTIPHKEAVLPLLDRVSARALRIGAVNTLYWEGDSLCGENTDVDGFLAPLRGRSIASALVLGCGGAARAVLSGLIELGVTDIRLSGRSVHNTTKVAAHFGVKPLPWEERTFCSADLVVNTTPLGMRGAHQEESPLPTSAFLNATGNAHSPLAYDLVYNPLHTRFLNEAAEAGWQTQDGLDMFVGQALAQQKLWTGLQLPAADLRQMLKELLDIC